MWTNKNLCNIIYRYLIHLNIFHWKAIALWYSWKIKQRTWHWIGKFLMQPLCICFSSRYHWIPWSLYQGFLEKSLVIRSSSSMMILLEWFMYQVQLLNWGLNQSVEIPYLTIAIESLENFVFFPRRCSIIILWCSTTWNFTTSLCQPNGTRLIQKKYIHVWSVICFSICLCGCRVWKCHTVAGIYWKKDNT